MNWEVEVTDEFVQWWGTLLAIEQDAVEAAVELLEEEGPTLGRPIVDTIKESRFPNMKELRPMEAHIRILFAFDPRRIAILLLGGDKSGKWNAWYRRMVPMADALYEEHLKTLQSEREGERDQG